MRKIIPVAVALCCTLLLSACFPPVTSHPVGGAAAKPDVWLYGLWKAKMTGGDSENNKAYFHFVPKNSETTLVLIISAGKKPDADVMGATVTAARIGNSHFLNAKLVSLEGKEDDADGQPPGTIPVLYRGSGRHITLYLMDEKATKDAINSGKIAGTVESGQYGDATITADQATLDKFIASPAGLALFTDKFAELTRMD